MGLKLAISLSLLGQMFMVLLFTKEALLNKAGTYCWLKCTASALLFGALGLVLAWGLYMLSMNRFPL